MRLSKHRIVKSFLSQKAHKAVVIFILSALNRTPVHTATDTGPVHRPVCLFNVPLSLVINAPTHGGMARLS